MSDELKVYAACPHCGRKVLTVLAPDGKRFLPKHPGPKRRGQCPGSFTLATGIDPPPLCAYGCGAKVSSPGFACGDCIRWATETRERIARAGENHVPANPE